LAESKIKKGLWEVTAEIEMQGLPISLPAVTTQQCFDEDHYVPKSAQQNENCAVSQQQVNGSTIQWTILCQKQEGTLKGNGEIKYSGDQFTGFLNMILSNKDGQLQMNNIMKGRYLGPCK
jgi:hypothetical protein